MRHFWTPLQRFFASFCWCTVALPEVGARKSVSRSGPPGHEHRLSFIFLYRFFIVLHRFFIVLYRFISFIGYRFCCDKLLLAVISLFLFNGLTLIGFLFLLDPCTPQSICRRSRTAESRWCIENGSVAMVRSTRRSTVDDSAVQCRPLRFDEHSVRILTSHYAGTGERASFSLRKEEEKNASEFFWKLIFRKFIFLKINFCEN